MVLGSSTIDNYYLGATRLDKLLLGSSTLWFYPKVINGTFDSDVSGWDVPSGGLFTWVSGRGVAENDTSIHRSITQTADVMEGESYSLSIDAEPIIGTDTLVAVTKLDGISIVSSGFLPITGSPVNHVLNFTVPSGETQVKIKIYCGSSANGKIAIDNVEFI